MSIKKWFFLWHQSWYTGDLSWVLSTFVLSAPWCVFLRVYSQFVTCKNYAFWFFLSLLLFLYSRFGRKRVLYTSWTAMVVGPLTCSIVHNFWLYTGIAFAIGCAQGGVALTIYVMASELVGPQYKSITSGAGTGLTYTLCLCLLSLQAWLIQNWRLFLVVTSAPYLILLLFYK